MLYILQSVPRGTLSAVAGHNHVLCSLDVIELSNQFLVYAVIKPAIDASQLAGLIGFVALCFSVCDISVFVIVTLCRYAIC
jgi:hypothetical protein